MNWYLQSGKDSDVVLSTRIRFSRNIAGFPFQLKNKQQNGINKPTIITTPYLLFIFNIRLPYNYYYVNIEN